MTPKTELLIRYRDERTGEVREQVLGEYGTAWGDGVTLGSAPGSRVVLEGTAPQHALARRGGHHTILSTLEGEVRLRGKSYPPGTEYVRVDQRPFRIGPYTFQFSERYDGKPAYLCGLDD